MAANRVRQQPLTARWNPHLPLKQLLKLLNRHLRPQTTPPATIAEGQQTQGEQQPKRRRGRPPRNPQPEQDNTPATVDSENSAPHENNAEVSSPKEENKTEGSNAETAGITGPMPKQLPAPAFSNQESAQDERPRHGVFIRPGQTNEQTAISNATTSSHSLNAIFALKTVLSALSFPVLADARSHPVRSRKKNSSLFSRSSHSPRCHRLL